MASNGAFLHLYLHLFQSLCKKLLPSPPLPSPPQVTTGVTQVADELEKYKAGRIVPYEQLKGQQAPPGVDITAKEVTSSCPIQFQFQFRQNIPAKCGSSKHDSRVTTSLEALA